MLRVLVPLAPGFEELEAVTITDLLVRAGIEVTTAGLDEHAVTASRGTTIVPDVSIDNVKNELFDLIVLPGGLPGADHLQNDARIQSLLKNHAANNKYIAAICAAPKALNQAGLLDNKTATAYPGVLDDTNNKSINISDDAIVIDGNIITSRGPGTAIDFTLKLIELLVGRDKKEEVEKQLVR